MCKNKRVRQIFEMGSENADNTIEENDRWKVGSKTYLALLLYSFHDPKQHDKADELSKNGFQMANELDMNRRTDRDKPKTFHEKTSARSSLVAVSCDVPKRDPHHFPSKGQRNHAGRH